MPRVSVCTKQLALAAQLKCAQLGQFGVPQSTQGSSRTEPTRVLAIVAVVTGKRRALCVRTATCPWDLSQQHIHKYYLFSLRARTGCASAQTLNLVSKLLQSKSITWHQHVKELLEFLKEFRTSSLKINVTSQSNTHRLRKRIKDCDI